MKIRHRRKPLHFEKKFKAKVSFRRQSINFVYLSIPYFFLYFSAAAIFYTQLPHFFDAISGLPSFLLPFGASAENPSETLRSSIAHHALPFFLAGAVTSLSLGFSFKRSALRRILCTFAIVFAFRIAWLCDALSTFFHIEILLEFLSALLLFLYAYRLLLCIALGFPGKHALPGTGKRLISFILRYILWILLLAVIRYGLVFWV